MIERAESYVFGYSWKAVRVLEGRVICPLDVQEGVKECKRARRACLLYVHGRVIKSSRE